MSNTQTVTVSILDKQYQFSCKPEEVSALRESASYLDAKMREVKSNSTVLGLDRIAVMAALNIANDFLAASKQKDAVILSTEDEIHHLNGKLDQALNRIKSINR
ncbi:MAG: cell division protein ZapA [Pseudomonadales bacterium]|nr:cell division protein ZapA [Pseudomonadales bacterium]